MNIEVTKDLDTLYIYYNNSLMLFIKELSKIKNIYSNNINSNVWEIEIHDDRGKIVLKMGNTKLFLAIIDILNKWIVEINS